nr:uncharacterized protein LOC109146919 [Ipomoea batatas]
MKSGIMVFVRFMVVGLTSGGFGLGLVKRRRSLVGFTLHLRLGPVMMTLYRLFWWVWTFADLVAEKTTALARSILEVSELFKIAREGDLDGEVCRQMRDAIQILVANQKLANDCPVEGVGVDQPSVTPCQENDETPSGVVVAGLDVDGGPDSPEFVTPPKESVHRNEGCDPSRSDGLGCRAPVKVGRALRPPPAAGRGLDCIDGGSGGPSELGLGALNDLPEEAIHTVVDGSYDRDLRVGWFRERLLLDFESSPYGDFKEVDLMFFPIIRSEHYFLLCFDFRRYRFEIIDNSSSSKPKKDKYGECLIDMVLLLCPFPPHVAHVLDFFLLFSMAFSLLLLRRFPLPLL